MGRNKIIPLLFSSGEIEITRPANHKFIKIVTLDSAAAMCPKDNPTGSSTIVAAVYTVKLRFKKNGTPVLSRLPPIPLLPTATFEFPAILLTEYFIL